MHPARASISSAIVTAAGAVFLVILCIFPPSLPRAAAQGIKPSMPTPPRCPHSDADKNDPPAPPPRAAKTAQLARDEKDFREGVEHLYQLAAALRQSVQQTPTSQVLSISMVKQTEAIEKLAKQLKNKAKGR